MRGKTIITTFVSIVFAVTVIVMIGVVTAKRTVNPKLSYSKSVQVVNGQIVNDDGYALEDENYFEPVGEQCVFNIDISGDQQIMSQVKIYAGKPSGQPLTEFDCANITMTTEALDVKDQKIFIDVSRSVNGMAKVSDGEYVLSYTFELVGIVGSASNTGMVALIVGVIAAFVIFLLILLNRTVNSAKEYDERQLRMRGIAGLNAMVTAACILMGFGMVDMTVGGLPMSVYQVAMITIIVSVTVFVIVSDINDAYFGIRQKRLAYTIICGALALLQTLSWLFNGLLASQEKIFDNLAVVNLVLGVCLTVITVELIIKGISERKQALREAEDEES